LRVAKFWADRIVLSKEGFAERLGLLLGGASSS
jgi:hypothetical protein